MFTIRPMENRDTEEVLAMMKVFYDSPAILHKASEEVLRRDIRDCVRDVPFVEGFVFEKENKIAGYSMIAKSYSTEYGGICIWIEDLYIKPEYRGSGIGTQFFSYLEEQYGENAVRLRLEVEKDNARAIGVYKKCGYQELSYVQMTKEI
ncbi:GNAT family N-acetyltransferase [Roseburia sp. 499]|uniref:GNAT family N-acetyltransferase n=1 Tax=Roseburia sp. 499 TaxID=1261634 RepID=UPI0009532B17|nr:GNAT family N-acetyltransferase [Roseburia sp. 499]WVK68872.1 GNAT family N-acetyltransferase [Roseburia sp. 499]